MNSIIKCALITLLVTLISFFYTALPVGETVIHSLHQTLPPHATQIHTDNCIDTTTIPTNTTFWHDEFNSNCLDTNKWNIDDWSSEKNNELQYYSKANITIRNGILQLISKEETFKERDFTSGSVNTKGKFEFLYGKVEMRAKLPSGQGIFPAFWMLTNNEHSLPEIDILELLGQKPNEIWMVMHWLGQNNKLNSTSTSYVGPNFSHNFHTFGIEWTPTSITWFIDNIERFSIYSHIPNKPMYLNINTAIGGNWPKSPDNTTIFPVQFEIDYVRVYTTEVPS